jgi:hypothetical protein
MSEALPESKMVPAPVVGLNARALAGISTIFLPTLIPIKFT